jgi:hypothetical protein
MLFEGYIVKWITLGFAAGSLKTIYPNGKFLVVNTSMEEEAIKSEYRPEKIQMYEYNAYACALVL